LKSSKFDFFVFWIAVLRKSCIFAHRITLSATFVPVAAITAYLDNEQAYPRACFLIAH